MKPWQKGYELEYLRGLEERWDGYNKHSLSPFSQMKKNSLANYLDKDMVVMEDNYSYITNIVNTPSKINMFKGVAIGEKQRGDRVVDKVNFDPDNYFDLVISNPPYIQLQKSLEDGSNKKYADQQNQFQIDFCHTLKHDN